MKSTIIVILLFVIFVLLYIQEPARDYTGITQYCWPDIAIDTTTERVYPKWKLSKKRLTKKKEDW